MKPKFLIDASERAILSNYGIATDAKAYMPEEWASNFGLATDAQPTLVTTPNTGIPAYLANFLDPEVVRVLVQPMKSEEIYGSTKKGDWTTLTTQFPVVESTGEVSSYGDWNNNGSSGMNVNFVPRQSYHFQTVSQWGERELEIYGLAKLNYVSEVNVASTLVINKFHNYVNFFGVTGLQLYGGLNDPNLIAAITPSTKAAGGTTWAVATAQEIYNDVKLLFKQLQTQLAGLTDVDAKMTLAISPTLAVNLLTVSAFNITAEQTIKQNFPNLRIVTAPEYSTVSGELAQLILDSVDGVATSYTAFTEKLRMHPIIPQLSAFQQKKSAGTWGTVFRRPVAISQMIGM